MLEPAPEKEEEHLRRRFSLISGKIPNDNFRTRPLLTAFLKLQEV